MGVKKLVIDLEKYEQCEDCDVQCSYKHHPDNNGIDALLEKIRFALICRKCETAPCVKACPQEALEKVAVEGSDEKVLKRATMLCTGCGTCAIACPFGTVYTELIPFATSSCDVCRGRLGAGEKPLCVRTCTFGGLDYRQVEAGGDMVEVVDDIVVKVAGGKLWEPFLQEKEKAQK